MRALNLSRAFSVWANIFKNIIDNIELSCVKIWALIVNAEKSYEEKKCVRYFSVTLYLCVDYVLRVKLSFV